MPGEMLVFRPMQLDDRGTVANMMKTLYHTLGAPDDYMTDKKIAATFQQLHVQPGHLQLDVFEMNGTMAGYALLFKFWYSEYGGMMLNIDELFVHAEFRGKGIASRYLSQLSQKKKEYVALSLEVLLENKTAYDLYRREGFKEKDGSITLFKLLE